MRVTRDDVARAAGISTAVVSYVVNNGPRPVSPATRERVLAAIEELGYRPNALAAALRTNRSQVIGLILPDNSNPFFAELARALEEAAFLRNYVLLLGNSTQDDLREATYVRAFLERRVDGLILIRAHDGTSPTLSAPTRAALGHTQIPLVILDRGASDSRVRSIGVDNADGAYQATCHLLNHGHANVACLAGPANVSVATARSSGWRRALHEAGIPSARHLLARTRFERSLAYTMTPRLLAYHPRPTALFVQSDEQAIGVLRAVAEAGLSVPEDLALVSFDGIAEGLFTIPSLTTIEQPFAALATRALDLLLTSGDLLSPAVPEQLPVHLRIRQSCGCATAPPSPDDADRAQSARAEDSSPPLAPVSDAPHRTLTPATSRASLPPPRSVRPYCPSSYGSQGTLTPMPIRADAGHPWFS